MNLNEQAFIDELLRHTEKGRKTASLSFVHEMIRKAGVDVDSAGYKLTAKSIVEDATIRQTERLLDAIRDIAKNNQGEDPFGIGSVLEGIHWNKNTINAAKEAVVVVDSWAMSAAYDYNVAEMEKIDKREAPYNNPNEWSERKLKEKRDQLQDKNQKLLVQTGHNLFGHVKVLFSFVPVVSLYMNQVCEMASAILDCGVSLIEAHNREIEDAMAYLEGLEEGEKPDVSRIQQKAGHHLSAANSIIAWRTIRSAEANSLDDRLQQKDEAMGKAVEELDGNVQKLNGMIRQKAELYNKKYKQSTIDLIPQYGTSNKGKEAYKMTEEAIKAPKSDPLVLDLNGDGIKTLGIDQGVYFDLDNNGFAEKISWFSSEDGILVLDKNENGIIDHGGELFGDRTSLSDGTTARSGFEALADFDKNKDDSIDKNDEIYDKLLVWRDMNQNGLSEENELFTLKQLGIASIGLGNRGVGKTDEHGNQIVRQGEFTMLDGAKKIINEYLLTSNFMETREKEHLAIDQEIAVLPNVGSMGIVRSLHQEMQRDETGELKELVRQFASEQTMDGRENIFKKILVQWSGVQWSEIGNRPIELHILDKFMGGIVLQNIDRRTSNAAYGMLYKAYDILYHSLYAELMTQTHFSQYLKIDFDSWTLVTDIDKLIVDLEESTSGETDKIDRLRDMAKVLYGLEGKEGENYLKLKNHFETKGALYAYVVNNIYSNNVQLGEPNQELKTEKAI